MEEQNHSLNSLPRLLLLFVFIGVIAGIGIYLLVNLGTTTATVATYSVIGETINTTNGGSVTVFNLGSGLVIGSDNLYNANRSIHYVRNVNYTMDYTNGIVNMTDMEIS